MRVFPHMRGRVAMSHNATSFRKPWDAPAGGQPMTTRNALIAALAISFSLAAGAHAFLDRAEPKVGSTVKVAPTELRLWFTEAVEPAFSTVQVLDADGKRVDSAALQVDPQDRKLLHVPLAKLPPGAYTAAWRIVSVDTHVSEGRFAFHVAP